MLADNPKPEAGSEWRTIARKSEFAAAFTANLILEASVLDGALIGVDAIEAFFVATAHGMYDSLRFTSETTGGRKTCLEWEGSVFGKAVGGTTVLTRDAEGLIESVHLYHRPLQVVIEFSKELARRLQGKVDPNVLGSVN
jgi:hypothetical protein